MPKWALYLIAFAPVALSLGLLIRGYKKAAKSRQRRAFLLAAESGPFFLAGAVLWLVLVAGFFIRR